MTVEVLARRGDVALCRAVTITHGSFIFTARRSATERSRWVRGRVSEDTAWELILEYVMSQPGPPNWRAYRDSLKGHYKNKEVR